MIYTVVMILTLVLLVVVGVWNWKLVTEHLVPKYIYLETDFSDYLVAALGYLMVASLASLMWPLTILALVTLAIKVVYTSKKSEPD